MKKYVIQLSLFLLFSIVEYIFLTIIWGKTVPFQLKKNIIIINEQPRDFIFTRLENIKKYNNIDILFLGSSHSFRGFDTRIFNSHGYKTFNLASSAQTPNQSEMLMNKYLNQLKPKMVVLETFPLLFETEDTESILNLSINGFYDINTKETLEILQQKDVKLINTLIYQIFRRGLKSFEKDRGLIYKNANAKYVEGGFVEETGMFNISKRIPYRNNKWKPDASQTTALDRIVKTLNEKKIKLILVQAPVTKRCYNYITNNDEIDAYFKSKGTYYNFNKLLKLNDKTDFYDTHHLTQQGVQKFDKAFIDTCLITH